MKTKFNYRKSLSIINWGISFDSLTELKFAISIRDEYDFLRACIAIYYHPGTMLPVNYIRNCHRRYTPDFLIRHKQTGEVCIVEIKPRAFESDPQLLQRKTIAENYISWKQYDWKFKVIFDDEIILSEEQLEDFEEYYKLKSRSSRKIWLDQYHQKFGYTPISFLDQVTDNKKIGAFSSLI